MRPLKRKGSLGRSTIIVTLMAAFSTMLGFGRESYIAYAFGATGKTDAYYIATVVPDTIAGLIGNALTNALIPVLKEERSNSRRSARRLIKAVFWGTAVVLSLLTFAAYLCRGDRRLDCSRIHRSSTCGSSSIVVNYDHWRGLFGLVRSALGNP